jgi:hypothetical protein
MKQDLGGSGRGLIHTLSLLFITCVCVRFEDFVAEETACSCKCFVHLIKPELHINKAVDASRRLLTRENWKSQILPFFGQIICGNAWKTDIH